MSEPVATTSSNAWQPLTPSGVARFASASLNRLFAVQIAVALIVAASVVWFISTNYSPVILAAIQELPDTAEISSQQLKGVEPKLLAENRVLSIGVELDGTVPAGVGDLQVRFADSSLKVCSLLGCFEIPYLPGWIISLGRSTLEPAWGAWQPMVLGLIALITIVGLLLSWAVLSTLYFWVPRTIAFYMDRELKAGGSWKLAGAAQMGPALFVAFTIVLYGAGAFDLLRFLIFYALHLPIAWLFVVLAPLSLPRLPDAPKSINPFSNDNQQ